MNRSRTPGHAAEVLRDLLGEPDRARSAQDARSAADAFERVVPTAARAKFRV